MSVRCRPSERISALEVGTEIDKMKQFQSAISDRVVV